MTVSTTDRRVQYSTNGTTGPFTVNFPFLASAHLAVTHTDSGGTETLLTLNVDYTVSGADVFTTVAYAAGGSITINREIPILQELDLGNGDAFPPDSVERAFDLLTMILQKLDGDFDRTLRVPEVSATFPDLPSATVRANRVLAFDANGDPVVLVGVDASSATALATDLLNVATASKGDALIGWSAVYTIVDGALTRHASISAAITALGATRGTIVVRDDTTVSANATVPATATLLIDNKAIVTVNTAVTLTINGRFVCDRSTCFSLTGTGKVVFARGSIEAVFPEWYGAKADAAIDASSGTDSTTGLAAAITAATLDAAGAVGMHELRLASGNYLTGNLVFPPAFTMRGTGRQTTNFVAKTGTTGKWFTDNGSASKIILEGFAMYARGLAGITHGLQLGRNGTEHGTEGYVKDIWVRDCSAAGAYAVDILANVGIYQGITVQASAKGIRIGGSPSHVSELIVMQPTEVGADLSYCAINGLHVEAPGNSCVPVLLTRNTHIDGLSIALANSTTISHLVELTADTTVWSVNDFMLFFGSTPAGVTVSNGNFKRADGTYFGGNATAGSLNGVGNYSSNDAGQKLQSFTVRITNTAGTLQHRISTTGGNASNFASAINGASASLTNTPTGTDSSTAMAAGAKIGSTSPSILWLDTISQKEADILATAAISFNSTGTALTVIPFASSVNINGVTRTRFGLQFFNLSGTAFSLNTTNITAGQIVQATVMCHLAH